MICLLAFNKKEKEEHEEKQFRPRFSVVPA
jgi:hypothetical protein